MGTRYLYGTILTGEAVAANNRGDNLGNTTTLQKVFHQDDLHTSVSAEAIRFAIRYRFQLEGLDRQLNRTYDPRTGKLSLRDEKRAYWDRSREDFKALIDDDVMGFMDAAAAEAERESEDLVDGLAAGAAETNPSEKRGKVSKGKKAKGKTTKRPSPLSVGRAVSLRPYRGEISFNCVSGEKEKGKLSLYSAEMHTTEYQYYFGLNLDDLVERANAGHVLDAIIDPPQVAGNHSRFAYDFSPASVVLRVTSAHSPRIQNCFEHDSANRTYTVRRLLQKVRSGDIPAGELIIGGEVSGTDEGNELKKLNVTVLDGVVAAAKKARTVLGLDGLKS